MERDNFVWLGNLGDILSEINGRDSGHKKKEKHTNERDIFMAVTLVSSL